MKQHFLHRRGKTLLCMFIIIPLLFNIAIVRIGVASSDQTKVYVDPPSILDTTLVQGKNFTINVNVFNVTNLYGYEIHLYYNTTILNCTGVELPSGHFLEPEDPTKIIIIKQKYNNTYSATHGRVLVNVILFWPEPVKNGSGTLITVTFNVTGIGECLLDLNPAKLGDPDGNPIEHEDVDGYFSNTGFCTPVADFTYTPTRPLVYETVTFNASASWDPDGNITSYHWDFGDNTTDTGNVTTHAYTAVGNYTVTLTVTDDDGRTDTITKDVKVLLRDIAITEIKVYPTVIPAGESAVINITVVNKGNWYYEWFNVTAYYENATAKYPIWYNETANQRAFFSVSVLHRGEDMNVIFNWNTTDIVGTRIYGISANACLVNYDGRFIPDESDTTNNAGNVTVTVKAPHDVAITAVEPSQKAAIIGEPVNITVTVKNEGNETETFEVAAYYDSSVIDMPQTVVSLDANASTTLIFKWNTTGVPEGIYTIRANATIVEDEVDTADNELSGGDILLSPVPVHDIAIIDTTVKPSELIVGGFVSINITLENQGTEPETFNVTVYYDSSVIDTETDVDLDTGDQTTLNFTWYTLGVPAGSYTIKAEVPPVPEETDTADNFFTDVTVTLTVKVTDHIEVVGGVPFHIVIESNSDVSNLTFYQADKEISFKVTGELATGFCNITIPNVLLGGPYTVFVDSLDVTPIDQPSNGTHTFLYFTYPHSTQTVHIRGATVATKPIASFDILPTDPIIGKPVTFNASASEDEDGYIVRYKWNFGDANITIVADPVITHIYSSADTYTVTLTVKDNNGLSSELAQKPITVLQPPTANFTYSPEAPIVDEAITFNATTSYDLDGEIVSYEWDFGDDTPAVSETSPNTTHSYTAAGLYTVTLTVTDDNNLTDTATADVTVLLHDIAVTSVTALPTKVTVGESISINVTVANEGNFSETFNVTVYYNGNILDTQRDITLSPGADTTLTFPWDTTNVPPDNYTISAKTSVVPNETDTANNEFIDGTVEVKETPTPAPVILYVAAAVAIVVIIATIMIYFIRFRKTS